MKAKKANYDSIDLIIVWVYVVLFLALTSCTNGPIEPKTENTGCEAFVRLVWAGTDLAADSISSNCEE